MEETNKNVQEDLKETTEEMNEEVVQEDVVEEILENEEAAQEESTNGESEEDELAMLRKNKDEVKRLNNEVEALKESIPELPNAKIMRYVADFGLSQMDATLIAEDIDRSTLFDACNQIGTCKAKNISNWILADIAKYTNETGKSILDTPLSAQRLCTLVEQVEKGSISNSSAKKVFRLILENDEDPLTIIEKNGMAKFRYQFLRAIGKRGLSKQRKICK